MSSNGHWQFLRDDWEIPTTSWVLTMIDNDGDEVETMVDCHHFDTAFAHGERLVERGLYKKLLSVGEM